MQAMFPMTNEAAVRPLFAGRGHLVGMIEAALSGMHGRVWTDSPVHPRCAVLTAGDAMLCGGEPGLSAVHMLRGAMSAEKREWLVDAPGAWLDVLRRVTTDFHMETRIAFDHDVQPEDAHLQGLLAGLPTDAALVPLDGAWFDVCRGMDWSRDFVAEYADAADYAARGLGVLCVVRGEPVAGASSYLSYPGGVEIQVQTREGWCGRGLATLASAGLILAAHRQGRMATWDAANPISAHMADRLGYRRLGDYAVAVMDQANV